MLGMFPFDVFGVFTQSSTFYCYFDSPNAKRKSKDQRFGFGGKKSGKKWNTKESFNDVSSFRAKVAHARGGKGGKKGKGGKQNVSHVHIKTLTDLFNAQNLSR